VHCMVTVIENQRQYMGLLNWNLTKQYLTCSSEGEVVRQWNLISAIAI
jgi:hypothetical protein